MTGALAVVDQELAERPDETTPVPRSPVAAYLASLGVGSRRGQARALELVAELASGGRASAATFAWQTLRWEQVQAVRSALAAAYAPAYGNKCLAALRRVVRACWRFGLLSADELARIADVEPIPGSRLPAGRALPPDEAAALLGAALESGPRDGALVAVLLQAGLRVAEATTLPWGHCTDTYVAGEACVTTFPRWLYVVGKGAKERQVPLPDLARRRLMAWAQAAGWPAASARVFPLTVRGVADVLVRLAARAEIPHVSPHDCRRTYITELLDRGAELATVAKLAGHADTRTTQRYDRRGLKTLEAAAALLNGGTA